MESKPHVEIERHFLLALRRLELALLAQLGVGVMKALIRVAQAMFPLIRKFSIIYFIIIF